MHGDDYFSNNCLKNLSEFLKNPEKGTGISNLLIRITKSLEFGNVKESEVKLANAWSIPHTGILMIQKN